MVICWWSGGITSAVACKKAIEIYGKENCRIVMIDTKNEHEDTYRFKKDCEAWYDLPIEVITTIGEKYESIEAVWRKHKSLNVANGAVCSSELKKEVRKRWQKNVKYDHQVFGFEFNAKEFKRAMSMKSANPSSKPIFPLFMIGWDKDDCIGFIQSEGIEPPAAYKMGFQNNNCLKTGCVQGGVGYWQKMKREMPELFDKMAAIEHELTNAKNKPVTMLKDQSKNGTLVFLKHHPDYPEYKTIDDMKGREPEPLMECNGFCGTNDLDVSKTQEEINFEGQGELFL